MNTDGFLRLLFDGLCIAFGAVGLYFGVIALIVLVWR